MVKPLAARTAAVFFAFGCLCLVTFIPADAGDLATQGYMIDTRAADLMVAHNERILVVFGRHIQFKRYFLVDMLSQAMTVATDVTGGVRYDLQQKGLEKALIIP